MRAPDPAADPGPSAGRMLPVALALYLLFAVGGAIWMALRDGRVQLDRYLRRDQVPLDLALGLAAGALLLGLWWLGLEWLPKARELERRLAAILSDLAPGDALALAIISGFAEETLFRGGLQGAFADPRLGLVVASVLFAALHTGPGHSLRLWTLFALLAGVVCGSLVLWRGTLLPAVAAHVLVNAVNLRRLVRARPMAE